MRFDPCVLIGGGCEGKASPFFNRPPSSSFLHQDWGDELFGALKAAGGKVYSNYAVG